MQKSETTVRMLAGAALFACGAAGTVRHAAAGHGTGFLVVSIIFMACGVVLFAPAAEKHNNNENR